MFLLDLLHLQLQHLSPPAALSYFLVKDKAVVLVAIVIQRGRGRGGRDLRGARDPTNVIIATDRITQSHIWLLLGEVLEIKMDAGYDKPLFY